MTVPWWGVFANYSRVFGQSQQPYGNSYWTTLVKFDEASKPVRGWTFPAAVIKRAEPMSMSGGSWGKDGLLYATGHDHKEVYALRLPKMGSVLELVATYPIEGEGRGIASGSQRRRRHAMDDQPGEDRADRPALRALTGGADQNFSAAATRPVLTVTVVPSISAKRTIWYSARRKRLSVRAQSTPAPALRPKA